jgi:hypothetical protein
MRIQVLLAGAAMALLASATAVSASATELVTNGGFETGDLTSWTLTGNLGYSSVQPNSVNSGSFAYSNGAVDSDGVLSQTVATVAGQSYDFSFWLRSDGGTPNDFTASLGGVVLQALTNAPSFGYTQFSGSVVALSDNAALSFAFRDDPGFWKLDDVSLVGGAGGVPEPATWGLMLTGFMGAGGAIRASRRRQAAVAV